MTAQGQVRTVEPVAADAPRRPLLLPLAVAAVLLVAVLVRLRTGSALWLDEALSVHIARLPLSQLHAALRQDGAPPVYYLLLHGWMRIFGESPGAVRALASGCALAALPLVWLVARRCRDRATAWTATLLLASSPFAVTYATESRMYALVVLEVLAGGLLLLRAWERPTVGRLMPVALVAALLVLTHYWSLYLLTCLGVGLVLRTRSSSAARRLVGALALGAVPVLPWLPTLLFQVQHTGTPWAPAPSPVAALDTVGVWAGGGTGEARLLALLLLALTVAALLGRPVADGLLLRLPADRRAARLLGLSAGPLLLGLLLGLVVGAGYAPRYSAVALPAALLLAAVGLHTLPHRARLVLTAAAVALGLAGAVRVPFDTHKTQARRIATAIRAGLAPGDVVVSCPDQLGVALEDLLPRGTTQLVYPTLAGPDRIDWVDYAQRNEAATAAEVLPRLLARAGGHQVWLVTQGGYRTFGHACTDLATGLAGAYADSAQVVRSSRRFYEHASLYRYSGAR